MNLLTKARAREASKRRQRMQADHERARERHAAFRAGWEDRDAQYTRLVSPARARGAVALFPAPPHDHIECLPPEPVPVLFDPMIERDMKCRTATTIRFRAVKMAMSTNDNNKIYWWNWEPEGFRTHRC